jgi:RNA polymerase sigma-70 factor (ECF subfamily)
MGGEGTDLAAVFATSAEVTLAGPERERVEAALTHALAEARLQYPGIDLSDSEFAEHLGKCLRGGEADAGEIASRVTKDIYLACGCVAGDETALGLLDGQVLATLPAAMGRLKLSSAAIDEAIQRARAKLLVGKEGIGKIADFSGTGDLRGWVKVIAIRDALRTARKEKREVSLSDELQAALPASALDPDLAYQQRLYRAEFKSSFAAAVDELTPRERTLLRQSIVYHSTVDQVAVVYQVHRATAARWIAKAKERLATRTRAHLRERLSLSESQFHSIVRLIESQMDLSVERLLATADGDALAEDEK